MSDPTAHAHSALLAGMGISLDTLGCIMLDVARIPVMSMVAEDTWYITKHPERFWIKGPVAEQGGHVTLLYGLLKSVYPTQMRTTYREAVDQVLDGWEMPKRIYVDRLEVFDSPYEDEPYKCIVGLVEESPAIDEAHYRLSFLPHLDTHFGYRPHITMGYVHEKRLDYALERLVKELHGLDIATTELNYGRG